MMDNVHQQFIKGKNLKAKIHSKLVTLNISMLKRSDRSMEEVPLTEI